MRVLFEFVFEIRTSSDRYFFYTFVVQYLFKILLFIFFRLKHFKILFPITILTLQLGDYFFLVWITMKTNDFNDRIKILTLSSHIFYLFFEVTGQASRVSVTFMEMKFILKKTIIVIK